MAVQSSEPVQKWFLQGHILPPILELLSDADATCRCGSHPALGTVFDTTFASAVSAGSGEAMIAAWPEEPGDVQL